MTAARDFFDGLAVLLSNPFACAAIEMVQLFFAASLAVPLLHVAVQLRAIRRLRAAASPARPHERVRIAFDCAVAKAGLRRAPRLLVTPVETADSFTAGWWRPDVCVSRSLAAELDDDELEAVLLHELAHVARRDALGSMLLLFGTWLAAALAAEGLVLAEYAVHLGAGRSRLLMAALVALFFAFRLAVLLPGRFLRELTCDDLAIHAGADPLALASALLHVLRRQPPSRAAVSSFAAEELFVRHRVRRLLQYERPRVRLATQRVGSAMAIAALIVVCAALASA